MLFFVYGSESSFGNSFLIWNRTVQQHFTKDRRASNQRADERSVFYTNRASTCCSSRGIFYLLSNCWCIAGFWQSFLQLDVSRKFIDYPFRAVKYLLLAFFAFAIFSMTETALAFFLSDTYNIAADVKMFYFFANISRFSLIVIGVLFFLSVIIRNFWCRYLCPYGALLGLIGFLSPNKIKRNATSCIDCGLCTKACPSFIKVDKVKTVLSDECTSCLNCIDKCPVADTLEVKNIFGKKKVSKKIIAFGIVLLFVSITGLGMITGHWHNKISK